MATRWYLRFELSYRGVQELPARRDVKGRSRHRVPLGAAVHATARRRRPLLSALIRDRDLVGVGAGIGALNGRSPIRSAARRLPIGGLAAAATYGVATAIGVTVT